MRLLALVFLVACGQPAAIPDVPEPPPAPVVVEPPAPEPVVVEPEVVEPPAEDPPAKPVEKPVTQAPVVDPPASLLRCKQDSDCVVSCADSCCGAPCGCHSTLTAAADAWYRENRRERCGDARRKCPPMGCAYEEELRRPRCGSDGKCTLSMNRMP